MPNPLPTSHGVVRDAYSELRLALVMNGGVSLAVWIGGVVNEMNRAVRAESAYGDLLGLSATDLKIDVITGASAGGINGALLALAVTHDVDLSPLRTLWLERGGINDLLRSPYERSATSLLRGDDYFLKELQAAFAGIKANGTLRPASNVPIELVLTTTLLRGEPNQIPDDLGAVMADVNHRGRFIFRRGANAGVGDAFADPDLPEQLALAARATASFPIAFEPVFCPKPPRSEPPESQRAGLERIANFPLDRYVLDGGILNNKPLEAAIDSVFAQRAEREVRRVLCYVAPDPGQTGIGTPDDGSQVPGIGEVALATLVNLPRVESIAEHLRHLVEHNRQVRHKRDARIALVRYLGNMELYSLAQKLFAVYTHQRADGARDYIIWAVSAGITQAPGRESGPGRRLRDWLGAKLLASGQLPWVPDALPSEPLAKDFHEGNWRWGAFTLEGLAEVMLDVLRRTWDLTPATDRPTQLELRRLTKAAYDLLADIPILRSRDLAFWQARGAEAAAFVSGEDPKEMADRAREWVAESFFKWETTTLRLTESLAAAPFALPVRPEPEMPRCRAFMFLAFGIAGVVAALAALARVVAVRSQGSARALEREEATNLMSYIDYLAPGDSPEVATVLPRLLALEVVQFALGTPRDVRDQFVELVQVSANGECVFGGPSAPKQKLAGLQLGHFGAFYKKSWRANDWMFGRLDGADRLARILMDPARLMRLYCGSGGSAAVMDAIKRVAIPNAADVAVGDFLNEKWERLEACISRELRFLDDPDALVPEQLPASAKAILYRLQLDILRDELPAVVSAVADDRREGARRTGFGANFEAAGNRLARIASEWRNVTPRELVELFARCRLGGERLRDEIGTDLFTKTLARVLAVTASSLSHERAGIGAARIPFLAFRLPMLALDSLIGLLLTRSRTTLALSVAALAAATTILLLKVIVGAVVPQALLAVSELCLVGFGALLLRERRSIVLLWFGAVGIMWLLGYMP